MDTLEQTVCPRTRSQSGIRSLLLALGLGAILIAQDGSAQNPPFWNSGVPTNDDGSAAISPQPWPSQSQWIPYSWGTTYPDPVGNNTINDRRTADPSNGGTTPQNYVSVSSGCPDTTLPSIYFFYNPATKMIYFRWRVEQIANNYATGPSPGAYGSTSPWNSALWTVFLSLTGDGYRDFAAHLDGSSGGPATPVDVLRSIWSPIRSNSLDYVGDPADIHSLFTNPTSFVNNATGQIFQFDGTGTPSTIQWPNGSSETTWDYGTTRSINISTSSCNEYFVDYEIPLQMLNATAFGGPKMTENTPFQFLFATANSLNNPFQKDVVWDGPFVCNATAPGPFGDAVTLAGGIIPQPITTSFTGSAPNSCNVFVSAQIMDALTVTNCQSINELVSAQFKYWYDANGNGLPDEAGGAWVNIGDPTVPIGTTVTANWNILNLVQGQYLLALEITDNRGHTTQTWATTGGSLTAPFGTDNNGPGGSLRHLYVNVPNQGLTAQSLGINYAIVNVGGACGAPPPTVTKTHNVSSAAAGTPITYTLTATNSSSTTIPLSSISDTLPTGFTYQSNAGGTITPSASPGAGATGTISWSFSSTTIPANGSATFSFTVNAGTSAGTFFNSATLTTGIGNLSANDTSGVTVTTASLTASKTASLESNPSVPLSTYSRGDVVRFTITYTNNSSTTVTSINVSDALPAGFTYAGSPTGPAPTSTPGIGSNGTVSWSGAWSGSTLAVGGSVTLTIDATATQAGSATNTALVAGPPSNAPQVNASVPLFVSGPVLTIAKTASTTQAVPPATVDYTIEYANVGNAVASITTLTDVVPAGFTLVTGAPTTAGCTQAGGIGTTVTCTFNNSLATDTTVPVTLRFTVSVAAPATSTNTATINASNATSVSTNFSLTTGSNTCTSSTFYFHPTTALVSASSSNLGIGFVTLTNGGTGYTTAPTITFSPSSGSPTATAHGVGGVLLGIDVTAAGSGYSSAPSVVITPNGGGTGAVASATMTDAQKIATTTAGSSPTQTAATTVGALQEFIRFYSDPPDSTTAYVVNSTGANTTVKLGWDRVSGNKIQDTVTLNDFNPSTNAITQISTISNNGLQGSGGLPQVNLTGWRHGRSGLLPKRRHGLPDPHPHVHDQARRPARGRPRHRLAHLHSDAQQCVDCRSHERYRL